MDNPRWKGVPFHLCSGKRLDTRSSRIVINFKHIPYSIFTGIRETDLSPNRLVLTVQPQEGLSLELIAKKPGPKLCIGPLALDFRYASILEPGESMPEAYERLLLDCMLGDQTLFLRSDTVRLAWNYLQPALKAKEKIKPIPYPAGSTPEQVESLLKKKTVGCIS